MDTRMGLSELELLHYLPKDSTITIRRTAPGDLESIGLNIIPGKPWFCTITLVNVCDQCGSKIASLWPRAAGDDPIDALVKALQHPIARLYWIEQK